MLEKKKAMGWIAEGNVVKEVDLKQFDGMKVAAKKATEEVSGFELSDAKKKEKVSKSDKARKEKAVLSDVGFKVADEGRYGEAVLLSMSPYRSCCSALRKAGQCP